MRRRELPMVKFWKGKPPARKMVFSTSLHHSSVSNSKASATAARSLTRLCRASKSATPSEPIHTTSASIIAVPLILSAGKPPRQTHQFGSINCLPQSLTRSAARFSKSKAALVKHPPYARQMKNHLRDGSRRREHVKQAVARRLWRAKSARDQSGRLRFGARNARGRHEALRGQARV